MLLLLLLLLVIVVVVVVVVIKLIDIFIGLPRVNLLLVHDLESPKAV